MNDTCKEQIGNWDYVTFGADTKIPYGLLSTDSNTIFFSSDTLALNLRMVSLPKVGT